MAFVPFDKVKQLATITQVGDWLGLNFVKHRAQCPINQGDKRELVITPEKNLFYCFGCKQGGDMIQLAAHVMQKSQKDAALDLQEKFHGYTPDKRGLPEGGLDYLESEHDEVVKLGFKTEAAKELGIGFAPKGTMRNHILIPLRDTKGKLIGYFGISPGTPIKLPKYLMP